MRKSKPILFSQTMSQAVLERRKTQTRRVLMLGANDSICTKCGSDGEDNMPPWPVVDGEEWMKCPYGAVGDLLWVREEHYRFGHWEPVPGVKTKGGKQKWRFVAICDEVLFDPPAVYRKSPPSDKEKAVMGDIRVRMWNKRLARFMPRALSRTTLEITDIRVEPLQDMSESDALAEGIVEENCLVGVACYGNNPIEQSGIRYFSPTAAGTEPYESAVEAFEDLWTEINGAGSYALNPWVWVLGIKVAS